jgi:hypothetical protein
LNEGAYLFTGPSQGCSVKKKGGSNMNHHLTNVLDIIGEEFKLKILKGSRHYIEVSVGKQAEKLGYGDLKERYKNAYAIVPLKSPQSGMKVRIDGRTFVNYAEYSSGIAVPGYLAREAGKSFTAFVPNDSMICNFT